MTAAQLRPTLLSSCARAATAAEARYRINAPLITTRASRIVALDEEAAGIVRRLADLPWSGGAHFLLFEAPVSVDGLEGLQVDATLRAVDGAEATLGDELTDADVVVMVATGNDGARAASIIGQACFARRIMTAGLVVAEGGEAEEAVAALRPHAMVLVVTGDEDDVPEMLTALRVQLPTVVINRVPNDRIAAAARLVFEEARKDGRDMAFAVVDEAGALVYGTRMDTTPARILKHAIRKAYTAAVMQRDTITLRDQDRELGKTLADWGDPMLTHLVGGVVIRMRGEWYGGMAVGGNSTERDDEIARMALEVLATDGT